MEDKVLKHKTEDITIIWKPALCTHAGICVKTLPTVYNDTVSLSV